LLMKGWTDEEESAFEKIMAAAGLQRMAAIRLYRRFNGDLDRALKYARERDEGKAAKRREGKRLKGVFAVRDGHRRTQQQG
jgi:hypothetical protein